MIKLHLIFDLKPGYYPRTTPNKSNTKKWHSLFSLYIFIIFVYRRTLFSLLRLFLMLICSLHLYKRYSILYNNVLGKWWTGHLICSRARDCGWAVGWTLARCERTEITPALRVVPCTRALNPGRSPCPSPWAVTSERLSRNCSSTSRMKPLSSVWRMNHGTALLWKRR